jgi:hypothetical protein
MGVPRIALAVAAAGLLTGLTGGQAEAFFDRTRSGSIETCYQQVLLPAHYAWVSKQVMLKPAWTEVVRTPARYAVKHDRRWVTRVRSRLVKHPPIYGTVAERVLVRPSHVIWIRTDIGC